MRIGLGLSHARRESLDSYPANYGEPNFHVNRKVSRLEGYNVRSFFVVSLPTYGRLSRALDGALPRSVISLLLYRQEQGQTPRTKQMAI